MNIELPIQFKNIELTDREKIFAWMIVELSKKLRTSKWTQYTFFLCRQDVAHILKRTEKHYFGNLHEVFKVGVLNKFTVAVSWLNPIKVTDSGPCSVLPATYTDKLESDEFIVMYAYLLGRMASNGDIFNDNDEVLKQRSTTHPINRSIHMLYKSYYADELYGDE